jgi:hypothetical protein
VYEAELFKFLLDWRAELGVASVLRFTNASADGAVVLSDGRRIAIEVKLPMHWEKACQAEWQFRQFLRISAAARMPVVQAGIVFFEEFVRDWGHVRADATERGWHYWYAGHAEFEGLRLDLLRFREGELSSFPAARSPLT